MVVTAADVKRYVARIEKAIKDPRKRALKSLDVAKLYKEAKCHKEAKESALEYLKVNSNDHRAYNLLGATCEDTEQWNDALKFFKRSIELQRSQKEILIKIVEVYSKVSHDEPEIAKVWADKADSIMPNHPSIFNLRWSLLINSDEKDFEEMEDMLAQELMRRPKDATLHMKLIELYTERGDVEEAYAHCKSLHISQVFQGSEDWLLSSADVFKRFHVKTQGTEESSNAYMLYVQVLCCLMDVMLKRSTFSMVREVYKRLDEAASEMHLQESAAMSADLQNEFEVFRTEVRAQLYFHAASLFLKLAKEGHASWNTAMSLVCACLAVSSSIGVPDKRAAWFIQKPSPENQKMIWHVMACVRRSQTDHLLLSLEKEHGSDWVHTHVSDTCCEPGKLELIEQLYGERKSHRKSFLMMDKEFLMTELELPNSEALPHYDQVAIVECPSNFDMLVWLGINCHFSGISFHGEASGIVGELFSDIQFEAKDLKSCSPFAVSSLDLQVFIEAVVYSGVDRMVFSNNRGKDGSEPPLLPLSISPSLCTNAQSDWWDAAYRLYTGKTWQVSTSKLKSIVQRGLEALRLIGNHGIDPVILKHVSESFFAKADEIQSNRENEWGNQVALQSFRLRGFHYGDEALKLFEINERDRETAMPKAPLIPKLLKPIKENERMDMIESLRMALADAAFQDDKCSEALEYLNGLFTADAAYKQAQIYRDLASRENHTNVEGLRSHLSFLRKSRDMLQTCFGRLEKTQVSLREKVQAEIDEIKEAITDQSGISALPNKVIDLRYSSDETEDSYQEEEVTQDDSATESKLALENSILHEQLAVRNHEFSVLAARIHKLEREMSEMRANQTGSESVIKPRRQDSSINTDESSSSAVYIPKDDLTSGSGNLTPRLEPEMSWDPFSPAPVFPVGFFSGLVDTVEKIDEEPENEVDGESDSRPADLATKSKCSGASNREETSGSQADENTSFGDNLHVKPLVSLTLQPDLTTGEESEQVVFKERSKLYRLHEGQWKERGIGDLKILLNTVTSKSRILMRREKVFKVCANHVLTDDMSLTKKAESANTFVWCTPADISDKDPVAETFAARFKTDDASKAFSLAFEKYKNRVSESKDDSESGERTEAKVEVSKKVTATSAGEGIEKPATDKFDSATFDERLKKEAEIKGAAAFSFKLDGGAQGGEDRQRFPTPNVTANHSSATPVLSGGFVLDPSIFKFNLGGQKSGEENNLENVSAESNPFLAAIGSMNSLSKSSPFAFGKLDEASGRDGASPFAAGQTPPQASTPLAPIFFQGTNPALAESTPNNAATGVHNVASPDTRHAGPDYQVSDYYNDTAHHRVNVNNQTPDQAQYFQSDWEGMQDRYYDAAPASAFDAVDQYYDENSFYQNEDDYYNDGEYYTAEDAYYGEEDAYYDNSEQGFEYYDQGPVRGAPNVGSDANSSQNEDVASSNQLAPRVVQMIDDEVFVTHVKKASFAQRAKASRLQLPSNFYAPSSCPPCPGCRGCGVKGQISAPPRFDVSDPESFWTRSTSKSEDVKSTFGAAATANSFRKTSGDKFLSFADLVSDEKRVSFAEKSSSAKSFVGTGSKLFAPKEEVEEGTVFDPTFKPIVELKKKEDMKTGEEGYTDLFKNRAKLFRFDFDSKQWKERGVGDMRLSYNPETSYCRVIMRRDQILKLCANHPVMPDIELKPHGMSDTSWVWVAGADYSEGEPQMQQFAVRFKTKVIADKFKQVFKECQKTIVKYLERPDELISESRDSLKKFQVEKESAFSEGKLSSSVTEDDVILTFVKKPTEFEKKKARQLLLPEAFFVSSSLPPCTGSQDRRKAPLEKTVDKADGKATFGFRSSSKQDEKTSFMSFADLASSSSVKPIAFASSGKAFVGAGKQLFSAVKEDGEPNVFDPTFKPIVELKKKEDMKTGEEGYTDLFKNRAKLFRFDFDSKQWKERGVGDMRLSYNPETSYCRVIMRRDQILKLCANHPVMPDIELKPHGMSDTSWVWVAGADYSEGEPQMQQFAVRFKTKVIADKFKQVFKECQETIVKYLEENDLPLSQMAASSSTQGGKIKFTFSKKKADLKTGEDSGVPMKSIQPQSDSISDEKATEIKPSTSSADNKNTNAADEKVSFGYFGGSSWTCSSCFVTNTNESPVCSSCKGSKPNGGLLGKAVTGLFNAPAFNFGSTDQARSFGNIRFAMKSRDNQEGTSAASGVSMTKETGAAQMPDDVMQKDIRKLNGAKGSLVCSQSNVANPPDVNSCVTSKKAEVMSSSVDQRTAKSNAFAMFKTKEGSWECPMCMLQNKEGSDKCISCNTDNPSATKPNVKPASVFGQQNSGLSIFGSQSGNLFPTKSSSTFPEPSFSMPFFTMVNREADSSSGTSKASPQIVLRSSPLSSIAKPLAALQPQSDSWECPTCYLSNAEDADKCKACSTDNPNQRECLTTKSVEQPTEKLSLFSAPTRTTCQSKTGVFSDFRVSSSPQMKFGGANTTNIFSTQQQQQNQNAHEAPIFTPSVNIVGPNSGQVPVSKSTPPKCDRTPSTPESPTKVEGGGIQCNPLVSLERMENQMTGEENEATLFCGRAKLYRFDSQAKQWKERGIGELKILQKRDESHKYRLVMRRDQIRKLCANHSLVHGMALKQMPSSDKMKIWSTNADLSDEEVKKETFAVRFKSLETLAQFEEAFKKATDVCDVDGKVKEPHVSSDSVKEEKRDDDVKSSFGGENVDVKLTGVVLPSDEDQCRADKLLLPKGFFNKHDSDVTETEAENHGAKISGKARSAKSFGEIFATPKVSLVDPGSDIIAKVEPKSPEKFSEDCSSSFTAIVQLDKVESETGEENETALFCEKAKLYRFDAAGPEWKERGFGDLKILKNVKTESARILMRRDHVKKICLNHRIVPGMALEAMANRRSTLIWFTNADYSEAEARAEKFAARFKNEEIMKRFKDCFDGELTEEEIDSRDRCYDGASVKKRDDDEGVSIKDTAVQKEEVTKPKDEESRKSVTSVETLGSGDQFLSKNQGQSSVFTFPQDTRTEGTSFSQDSTKSSFAWPAATSLFSMGSSYETSKEDNSDQMKTGFSWPTTGSTNLFSIGSIEPSSKSDFKQDATLNTSVFSVGSAGTFSKPDGEKEAANREVSLASLDQKNEKSGGFGLEWAITDTNRGPFSFTSFSNSAVEDVLSANNKKDFSLKSGGVFSWGGSSDGSSTPVLNVASSKDGGGDETDGGSVAKTPEKPEEAEVFDPSEAIVSLEKVESLTGEENEIVVFSEWAKAYRFDVGMKQWKERGKGDVKVLRHKITGQHRLLMRRDQVKKVAINHILTRDMKLEVNSTAKNSWIWFTNADFSDELPKPEKLAIRFRSEDVSNRFKSAFDAAIRDAVNDESVVKASSRAERAVKAVDFVDLSNNDSEHASTRAGDVLITYVKEPTAAELERANSLLLPRTFFAAVNSRKESSVPRRKQVGVAIRTETDAATSVKDVGSGFQMTGGLSFGDLISQPSEAFSGFKSTPDKKGFQGQGNVLFSKNKDDTENEGEATDEDFINFKPIVSLVKTETKSGEEEEEVKFAERCKLYRLDKDSNQWKERGVGELKILRNNDESTSRIIMRRDVVFKLGANHLIQPGMNLKPKQGLETIWVWKTNADISDDVAREETFTVKFKTVDIGRRFADTFDQCVNFLSRREAKSEVDDEPAKIVEQETFCGHPAESSQKQENSPTVIPGNQGVSSTSSTTIKKKEETSTFGSGFSGLDFSMLATIENSAFKDTSGKGFANAGARVFGSPGKEPEEYDARIEAIMQLERVETKSGEEEEEAVFESKVKLYRFCHATNQWKERGLGMIKLLRHEHTKAGRLIMRREVVLKLAANHSLTSGMRVDPMKAAVRTLMWKTAADVSDGAPTESMFAAKFKNDDAMHEFERGFRALCCGEALDSL